MLPNRLFQVKFSTFFRTNANCAKHTFIPFIFKQL